MSVKKVEKLEKNQVALTVEVGKEEFEAALEQAYRKLRGRLNVPGFRPGKAPRAIIEKRYGEGIFFDEAIDRSFPAAYMQAIADKKLKTVGQPKVEIESVSREGYTFKATVALYPEVKLGEYKGLSAPRDEVKVTAEDVQERLDQLAERETRLKTVERKAKKGDTLNIDFEGFDKGVPFEGGKGEHFDLVLGSGSFVPGFEDSLVGMKAGEEKDIDITFPKEYTKELAGKAVVFHVKCNAVQEKDAPKMDDEFAKDVSEFETLKELKDSIKKEITADRKAAADRAFEDMLLEQVAENITCDIPDAMVEEQVNGMVESFKNRLQGQGISYEDYMKYTGATEEKLRADAKAPAEKQVRTALALEAIVKAEKIKAGKKEIEAEYEKIAEQYGMKAEEIKKYVSEEEVEEQICRNKAVDLVVAEGKVGKAPEKKPAAKKSAAKKTEEKAEAKKPAAKKPAAKKTEEKAEAKKPAAKKPAAKKTEEKTEAKKPAAKKPAAKKTTAKKTAEEK